MFYWFAAMKPGINKFVFPLRPKGKNNGLTVIIDSHADIFSAGSISEDTDEFLGLIRYSFIPCKILKILMLNHSFFVFFHDFLKGNLIFLQLIKT